MMSQAEVIKELRRQLKDHEDREDKCEELEAENTRLHDQIFQIQSLSLVSMANAVEAIDGALIDGTRQKEG